jgi:ankyrin repeat protein
MAIVAALTNSADSCNRIQALTSMDDDGLTPLHYAVVGSHLSTLATLLDTLLETPTGSEVVSDPKYVLGDLLLLAIQSQKDDIVQLILDKGLDLGPKTIHGESALYVAAQNGQYDYIKLLLGHCAQSITQIELPEKTLGWTPSMVACATENFFYRQVRTRHN